MRISGFNNVYFQKRLAAKCTIGDTSTSQKAYIYELDCEDDKKILYDAEKQSIWQDNYYLDEYTRSFEKENCQWFSDDPSRNKNKYYIMEDKSGNMICYSLLDTARKKENRLDYLETAPEMSCYNKYTRRTRYVGETMLAFLAAITKKAGKDLKIVEVAPRPTTENFYFKQCKFKSVDIGGIMPYEKLGKFVKSNRHHTGTKIAIEA